MRASFHLWIMLGESPKETDTEIAGKPASMYLERNFA